MAIDIQKVPGSFSPPTNWPKIDKVDITTGLFADWDALSLEVGDLPAGGWVPTIGEGTLTVQGDTPNVQVVTDANGVRGVKFVSTRLGTTISIKGEATFLVALRPSGIPPTSAQRLFSGDANLFRGLYIDNKGFTATVGDNKITPPPVLIGPRPDVGQATVVAMRYGAEMDGKVMGHPLSLKNSVPGMPNQIKFLTGANASIPPLYLYDGLIYRYQMWNRLLSDAELDAAIHENAQRYKIA